MVLKLENCHSVKNTCGICCRTAGAARTNVVTRLISPRRARSVRQCPQDSRLMQDSLMQLRSPVFVNKREFTTSARRPWRVFHRVTRAHRFHSGRDRFHRVRKLYYERWLAPTNMKRNGLRWPTEVRKWEVGKCNLSRLCKSGGWLTFQYQTPIQAKTTC